MDKILSNIKDDLNNPLDTIEEMVVDNSWPHNRVNENILYVGTDHGSYISLDRGKSFMSVGKSLPNVPVHDLVIHPKENEL